jgi:hypothetical protein
MINSRKILIFGAGASMPFFCPQLSTNYLTEQISNSCNWEKIVEKYNQEKEDYDKKNGSPDSNGLLLDHTEFVTLIGNIRKQHSGYNFEQIAEVIDELSYYGLNKMDLSAVERDKCNQLSILYSVAPEFKWKVIPWLFRLIIAKSILELHKSKEYDKLILLQKKFIDSFIGGDEGTIFSLNYDDLLLDTIAGLNFELGFEKDTSDSHHREFLNEAKLANAQRAICFPHNQLRLVFIGKGNGIAHYLSDSKKAYDTIWENIFATDDNQTLPVSMGFNFNTSSVTTGQQKTDIFNIMPYSAYKRKMELDIAQSDKLVVVGYSFNDEHINEILKTCPSKEITIIDYQSDCQLKRKFKWNILRHFGCRFYKSTTFYFEGYNRYLEENYLD